MRRPIIAGNWKMNYGTIEEALTFVRQIQRPLNEIEGVDRVLCPPATVLLPISEILQPLDIQLGAQNMHWEDSGAHTGDMSPTMLANICDYVILGHSERRATGSIAETDEAINRKVHAAFAYDLIPIICVGENLQQNEAGETQTFVSQQVRAALDGLTVDQVGGCVIAYEPIWAIGTGKAATPADANRVIGLTIRGTITDLFDENTAQSFRVQYGGSVNVENIASFMAMPEIDGALVGGASLKADFPDLVRRGTEL
ncbi:MAG: triose-phosphate isomerase [Anaerolineales bacterium]|nr:triose-phosphate isomerase [Anaerolineales bacterium]